MLLRLLITPALLGGLAMARTSPAASSARVELPGHLTAAERTLARVDTAHVRADTVRARADTVPARSDTVREYRGVYESGFEVSWFHACDAPPGDDTWWVTLTNDALRERDSLAKALTGQPRAVLVRWRATVGPKMPVGAGHMGRGSRYMLVTKVLALSASDRAGCTSA